MSSSIHHVFSLYRSLSCSMESDATLVTNVTITPPPLPGHRDLASSDQHSHGLTSSLTVDSDVISTSSSIGSSTSGETSSSSSGCDVISHQDVQDGFVDLFAVQLEVS